ncbi:MAG: glycosyltransferase family A protein [Deltaproteobacteria bacterium]|nr:glycosyltransferase family A protein [Deltaproteobacteria bacterium]
MRIGVGIPTYNRPHGLRRALASVARQSRRADAVVVVNDAGENVERVVGEFGDLPLQQLRHAVNRGNAAARNTIVRALASVDVCVFLDDDDELDPAFLEHAAAVFLQRPSLSFGWPSQRIWTDESAGPKLEAESSWVGPTSRGPLAWLKGRRTGASGLTFRPAVVTRVGPFDESLRAAVDTDWLVRAATEESSLLDRCWLDIHREPQHAGVSSSFGARYRTYFALLKKHQTILATDPVFHAKFLARTARLALAADETADARELLLQSLRVSFSATTAATLAATFVPNASAAYRAAVRARSSLR